MKNENKSNKKIIIICIIIIFLIGVITFAIFKIKSNNETGEINDSNFIQDANDNYYENMSREQIIQQNKEDIFKETLNELKQYNLTLKDIEFEENSDIIANLLIVKEVQKKNWNWERVTEESYPYIDSETKKTLTSVFGPAYTMVKEELYAIVSQTEIEELKTDFQNIKYDTLKEIYRTKKWDGFKFSWMPPYIKTVQETDEEYIFNLTLEEFIEKYNNVKETIKSSQSLNSISISDFVETTGEEEKKDNLKSFEYRFADKEGIMIATKTNDNDNIYAVMYFNSNNVDEKSMVAKLSLMALCNIAEGRAEKSLSESVNNEDRFYFDKDLGIAISGNQYFFTIKPFISEKYAIYTSYTPILYEK